MELIVVSDHSQKLHKEEKFLEKLVEEGLETFHLRKPRCSKIQIINFLDAIPVHLHNKIILYNYPELLGHYNLKGFYFGKKSQLSSLKSWYLRKKIKWKYPHKLISTGIYDSNSLMKRANNYDYVFFGPVFSMKKGGRQAIHYDELQLKMMLRKCKTPVFARGGITVDNIGYISRLGFDGFALQSYIWESNDPIAAYKKVRDYLAESDSSSKIPMYS